MDVTDADRRVQVLSRTAETEATPELLVDGVPVRYGTFPDGVMFIYENAYVWSDDLHDLGRQFVIDRANGRLAVSDNALEGDD